MSSSQSRDSSSHIQSHPHGRMSSQRSNSSSDHPSHGSLPNFGYFGANIDDFDHNDKEFLMEAFGESTLNISDYMNHPAVQPHLLQGSGDRSDGSGKSMSSHNSRTMAPFGVGAENDYLSLNMFAGMPVPFPDGIYAMDPNIRAAGFSAPFLRGLHAGLPGPGALPIPLPPSDKPPKETTKRGAKKAAAPAPPPEAAESNKKPRKNAKKAAQKVEEVIIPSSSSSSSSSSSFCSSPVNMGSVGPAPTAAPVFAQGRKGQKMQNSEAMTTKALHALAAKEKRRERNKFLARKTRLRKREELDTLRDQVAALQAENEKLKVMVRTSIPDSSVHMETNDLDPALPEHVLKAVRALLAQSEEDSSSATPKGICITNATAPDHPIVYASVGFLELTGYDMHSILGHNCRILQGPDTDRNEVRKIKKAITENRDETVVIKNYRKDGTAFWNRLHIAPIYDDNGTASLFVGVLSELADGEGYNSATSSGCGSTSSAGSLRPKSSSASGSNNDTPSECDGSNDGTNDGTNDSHEEDFTTTGRMTDKAGSVFSAPSSSATTSFSTNSSTHSSHSHSSSNAEDGCGGSVSSRCSGSSSGDAIKSRSGSGGSGGTGVSSGTESSPGDKALV